MRSVRVEAAFEEPDEHPDPGVVVQLAGVVPQVLDHAGPRPFGAGSAPLQPNLVAGAGQAEHLMRRELGNHLVGVVNVADGDPHPVMMAEVAGR